MRHGLGYRVMLKEHTYGIGSLELEVLNGDASHPTCVFHWQRNTDKEDTSWYAFQFQIERRGLPELTESAALVRRVLRNLGREPSPAEVIGKLERLAIPQVVYDSRVHELCPLLEVAPPEYRLYLEEVFGERYAHCSVLARNDEEAQRLLAVKLAENGYDDILVRWIEGGKQLRRANDRAPDITPASEIIA